MAEGLSTPLLRRWIALYIRQLRLQTGMSNAQFAKALGMSHSAVSHLESGRYLPSRDNLAALATVAQAPSDQVVSLIRLVDSVREGKDWWDEPHLRKVIAPGFDLYLGLEAGASEISTFHPYIIPGLLQTQAYAEAIFRGNPNFSDEVIAQSVELRMRRQQILDRTNMPVQVWAILDEAILYRKIGNRAVMHGQLTHLLKMNMRPNIEIQILPLDAGSHAVIHGAMFTILGFPPDLVGDPGVVYQGTTTDGIYLEAPEEIAAHHEILDRLRSLAAPKEESQELIQKGRSMWKEVNSWSIPVPL